MRKTIAILIPLLAVTVCSCERKDLQETGMQFLEAGTATTRVAVAEEGKCVWKAGDALSVFYKSSVNEQWSYLGEDGAPSGKFGYAGSRIETGPDIVALSPYMASAKYADGLLSATLPSAQNYVEGSFDPDAALMVAKASSGNLQFRFATGFVCLRLKGNTSVRSIVFEGLHSEKVSGNAWVDLSGDDPLCYVRGTKAGTKITLSAKTDVALKGDTPVEFWFCVPPMTFDLGYKLTASYSGGSKQEILCAPAAEARAGEVRYIDAYASDPMSITIDFTSKTCPLIPSGFTIPTEVASGSVTVDGVVWSSQDGRITSDEGDVLGFTSGGKDYSLTIQANSHYFTDTYAQCGYYWKSGSHLRIQSQEMWLRLPAVEGKALTMVSAGMNCSGSKIYYISKTPSTEGTLFNILGYGSGTATTVTSSVYVSEPEVGVPYYMYSTNGRNSQFTNLTLYYE